MRKYVNFILGVEVWQGKWYYWIEPLGNCACEGKYDEMYGLVEAYFERKGFSVEYDEQKMNFVV